MADTIFTRIIRGEIPCYKIAENEKFFAFLDINPVQPGHTLIVPKTQVDYFFDLGEDYLAEIMLFSKEVAARIKNAVECNRVAVVVIGLEVPHAHLHLIPISKESDLDFTKKKNLTKEQFEDLQKRISL